MAKKPKKPKTITQKEFSRWSPEKRQAALNDRRTRIRIEDKALPAEWLQRRQQSRWNRTPITEGTSTTYGDLEKQRKYLEPLTFGEGDRQLADRGNNLAAARQRDADWFTQYRQQVSDAQNRAIGAQQQAVTGNQQLIQSATDASNNSRDAVVKQLQDRAAQLGQTSQAPEYQGLADAATAVRAAGMTNTAQRQIANAQTDVNAATNNIGVAGLKDLEAQGYRDRQSSALDQDRRDYGTKKDAWRAKFIDDAISEARKQVLEDRVFQLNAADKAADNKLAAAKLKSDQRLAQARLDIQRGNLDIAAGRLGLSQQELQQKIASGYFDKTKSGKDDRSSDKTRRAKRTEAFNSAVLNIATPAKKIIEQARAGAKAGTPQKKGPDFLIRGVMGEYKVSREIAKRIVYAHVAYNGNVPSNVTWKNAPKTWEQAVARYRRGR